MAVAPLTERTYSELTTAELREMTDRAYWRAVREWREFTAARRVLADMYVQSMLRDSAQTADDLHRSFRAELDRRDSAQNRKG